MERRSLLWLALVAVAAFSLFHITYRVKTLEGELAALNGNVAASAEAIHVLRAEWSYLTRPDRLAELAARHLDLQLMTAAQIVTIDEVPLRIAVGVDRGIAPAPAEHRGALL